MSESEITKAGLKELWGLGETAYFEYHCLRSHSSGDAEMWYRDHQPVTILEIPESDGKRYLENGDTAMTRLDDGAPLVYQVEFSDGFKAHATEDELFVSPKHFDPNLGPPSKEEIAKARRAK